MRSVLVVLLLLFFQMAPHLAKAGEEAIQSTYDEDLLKQGIRFTPPSGSRKVKAQSNGIDGVFFILDNKFLVLILSPVEMPAEDFDLTVSEQEFRKDKKFEFVSEEKTSFLDVPCYIVYRRQQEDEAPWIHKSYHFYKNGKAYLLDFNAMESGFNNYASEFENILNNFSITE